MPRPHTSRLFGTWQARLLPLLLYIVTAACIIAGAVGVVLLLGGCFRSGLPDPRGLIGPTGPVGPAGPPGFVFKWAYAVSAFCIVGGILSPILALWFPVPPKLTGTMILCGIGGYTLTYVWAVSFWWILALAIFCGIVWALHIAFTYLNHKDGGRGCLIWVLEKWTKRDLDGDGSVGAPVSGGTP